MMLPVMTTYYKLEITARFPYLPTSCGLRKIVFAQPSREFANESLVIWRKNTASMWRQN